MEKKLETVIDFPHQGQARRAGDVETCAHPQRYPARSRWTPTRRGAVGRGARAARDRAARIELVEQPVPREDLDGLRWVRERSGIRCSPTRAAITWRSRDLRAAWTA
jgi:hypothetical protein